MAGKLLFVDCGRNSQNFKNYIDSHTDVNWKTDVCTNGSEAIAAFEREDYDAVISELKIPDMNGIEFFKTLKEQHPQTIRILHTVNECPSFLYTAQDVANIIVNSNCEENEISEILNSAVNIRNIFSSNKLHKKIASIDNLPVLPETYQKLNEELKKDNYSISKIGDIIKGDVGITAKLLQLINSAYFGMRTHVESPQHAVRLLGIDMIKGIVLSTGVFENIKDPEIPGFSFEKIYNNSVAVGTGARLLASAFGLSNRDTEDALLAGMLHDIGKLVMLNSFSDELIQAKELAEKEEISIYEAERKVFGVTDTEIGGYLLSYWNLPVSIQEAVALYPEPKRIHQPSMNILTAVHLSFGINMDRSFNIKTQDRSFLDYNYLDNLKLTQNLENLKQFCMAAE